MDKDFLKYQAQTTTTPLGLTVSHAQGSYIYDTAGRAHLDFVAGVSACGLGHCHPRIVRAIKEQSEKYLHVMVYGEYVQDPALRLTKSLANILPDPLEMTYLVNSGTEAIEGAIKLARRYTGRSEIIAARNAYHGNTMGSLSLMSHEEQKAPFRPLLPDVRFIDFNVIADLEKINKSTAAVVLETIQGGAGFILPASDYLREVQKKCKENGALLILDEIQPGFGRTGKFFAFEHYGILPDILVMGKSMASGLPVGAFTSSRNIMLSLSQNPALGHITTFGGNAVVAAAALATLQELQESDLIALTLEKEQQFRQRLRHPLIEELRGKGLMLAMILKDAETANRLVMACASKGLVLFWLLFEKRAVRISPPLTISREEIDKGCEIILEVLEEFQQ
ncbi:MAG: aminotransferase class III-fold pyridoxal phosphate-dependent enzyme [Flavobacteriaceae bacterium]